jgi:hypothetical protein
MKSLMMRFSVLVLLLSVFIGMTLAQESTDTVQPSPTMEVVTVDPVVEAPAPEFSFIDADTLLIAGSILVTIIVGGAFFLTHEALKALKVSVPQETYTAFGNQIVGVMTNTMAALKDKVEATSNPVDDVVYNVGKIGTDFLIEEIKRRNLSSEQFQAVAALGQGYGKQEIGSIG